MQISSLPSPPSPQAGEIGRRRPCRCWLRSTSCPVERVETSRWSTLGSEGWSTAWVVRVASYHASISPGAFLRAHNALTPCDQIGPLTAPRRPASGPLLATSFDRSAETSLLRPRHASREPSVASREAGDGICPGAPAPATSKVGPSWACPYGARARLLPSQRRHRGTALPSGQVWHFSGAFPPSVPRNLPRRHGSHVVLELAPRAVE